MSSFSKHLLGKKLSDINQSKESIRTLALWIVHHRKHAPAIVQFLSSELLLVSEKQKVAFLFLVNELIRSSRSKDVDLFRMEFEKVLPEIFYHLGENVKDPVQMTKIHRLLNVWSSENLFRNMIIEEFWSCLNKGSISSENMQNHDDDILNEPHDIKKLYLALNAPNSEELIHGLESLEDLPSSDIYIRDEINSLPKTLLETKAIYNLKNTKEAAELLEQLDNAANLVEGYNNRLEEELKQRKNFHEMLLGYNEVELEQVEAIEKKLKQVETEIEEKLNLREELQRHRESLPDLNHLSDVTKLPPLPTAQDLFKPQKST